LLHDSSRLPSVVLFLLALVSNLLLLVGVKLASMAVASGTLCSPVMRRRVRRLLRCCCLLRKVALVCRQEKSCSCVDVKI
jgi:hypothetical protein